MMSMIVYVYGMIATVAAALIHDHSVRAAVLPKQATPVMLRLVCILLGIGWPLVGAYLVYERWSEKP